MRLPNLLFNKKKGFNDDVEFYKSKINYRQFRQIHDQYINAAPFPGYSKYLDIDKWIGNAVSHLQLLGLPHGKNFSILDIGTGAGYFPFVARHAGHEIMTIDIPENDFYRSMTNLLKIPRCEHKIQAFQPLPTLGRRFDVVTAFAICFNNHATEKLWGPAEWQFFIDDLKNNIARKNSLLFLKFNSEPDGHYMGSVLQSFFRALGAKVDKSNVRIKL